MRTLERMTLDIPGGYLALSHLLALLGLQHDAVLELQPPHEGGVDTVGQGHGTEGDQSAHQRGTSPGHSVEAQGGTQGGAGGGHVAGAQGGQGDGGVGPGPAHSQSERLKSSIHPVYLFV